MGAIPADRANEVEEGTASVSTAANDGDAEPSGADADGEPAAGDGDDADVDDAEREPAAAARDSLTEVG
jgi:hypothetical protein